MGRAENRLRTVQYSTVQSNIPASKVARPKTTIQRPLYSTNCCQQGTPGPLTPALVKTAYTRHILCSNASSASYCTTSENAHTVRLIVLYTWHCDFRAVIVCMYVVHNS